MLRFGTRSGFEDLRLCWNGSTRANWPVATVRRMGFRVDDELVRLFSRADVREYQTALEHALNDA